MIGVNDILKIVKLVLLSGYLKKQKPLSLLLIGEVGSGKTEITTNFKSSRIVVIGDLSKSGVYSEVMKNKSLKHIVIPDFLKITNRRRATAQDLITTLNSATEEGLTRSALYRQDLNFKGKTIGLITSTTKASYSQHYKEWKSIGFLSRMIICSFSYNNETHKKIMQYIQTEKYLDDELKQSLKGYTNIDVKSNFELNQQLEKLSRNKYRTQKQLQTMAKSHAILRKDNNVRQQDIDEIIRLSKYLNLNYTRL